jgi:hypothetical protein
MNPTQNNSGAQGPAPANYTGGDYSLGSVNAPGGPAVIPPQQAQVNPNSTQNALQISEIRDGVVIMSDGSFRAVVMCHSINFDLMSPQEREAVEFSYQGFLNSLYFPVQIFIRSKEQDNMLLGLLMEDYIAFLADIAQQTNIMDKKFYLVVKFPDTEQDVRKALKQSASFFTGMAELLSPSKQAHVVIDESTLEKAKTELRNRIQAVMQGLAQCGIQSLPLDTEELIELYYDAYNPDTATRQQIKNFKDLTAPIVTKGEGSASQPQLDREAS